MAIRIEILPPERTSAAPVSPSAPAVTGVDAVSLRRIERRDPKTSQGVSFRAALDAATFNGVISTSSASPAAGSDPEPRPTKLPTSSPDELTLSESAGLLGAAQTVRSAAGPSAPELEAHRAAAQRYAKTFFSDTRTFARPGESLEISA
jgi:hypothetical protein